MSKIEICCKCGRERPTYISDPSCVKGNYCDWRKVPTTHHFFYKLLVDCKKGQHICLHLGCGTNKEDKVYANFRGPDWIHVRIDADAKANPDIVDSVVSLESIPDNSVDGIYLSHTFEHLEFSDIFKTLDTFHRVLREFGQVVLIVPDLQAVGKYLTEDRIFDTVYVSPAGPISAFDMLYGYRGQTAGNQFMQHKSGFTKSALERAFLDSEFMDIHTIRDSEYNLWGFARKPPTTQKNVFT